MKNVHELTDEELDELREAYFFQLIETGEEELEEPTDIPMDIVKDHYSDVYFVEDDFFCNLKD